MSMSGYLSNYLFTKRCISQHASESHYNTTILVWCCAPVVARCGTCNVWEGLLITCTHECNSGAFTHGNHFIKDPVSNVVIFHSGRHKHALWCYNACYVRANAAYPHPGPWRHLQVPDTLEFFNLLRIWSVIKGIVCKTWTAIQFWYC